MKSKTTTHRTTTLTLNLSVLAFVCMAVAGCTKPAESKALLEGQGLKDVVITGYNFFGCSEDDDYRTGFRAVGFSGQVLTGTVCSGLFFKGATIRYGAMKP